MNDEAISAVKIHDDVYHLSLSPIAKLTLIWAMTHREAHDRYGITTEYVSKVLGVPFYTARRGLTELRKAGLASFHTISYGRGQIHHEWKFRWPTPEEVRESFREKEAKREK